MRILKLVALSTVVALALVASPALAQGAAAAVLGAAGWSEFISTTLNQLLVASGVGVGGGTVAGLFQLVKLLVSLRQSIDAGTANKADTSQASLIEQVIQQGVAMIAGLKQTAPGSTNPLPVPGAPAVTLSPDDVEKAVNFARNALIGHGLTLDSDVIRGKVHAVLGDIALKLPPLPALPFDPFRLSPTPKPNTAQAAAATAMTG